MCGILVCFSQNKFDIDHPSLASIAHRGPDGVGIKMFQVGSNILTLGHRRLSIIDLSEEAGQPMQFQDSGLWITFNGEIYNYLELRADLQRYGYQFKTNSDTEVLLAAYHKWGSSCLKKLNGMFAFAIWNEQSGNLFVARDRYGVKPLYYWNSPVGLLIVSEIKQFNTFPGFNAAINKGAAFQYLYYGDFSYGSHTLWKDVLELEPGRMFSIDFSTWETGNDINTYQWYDYTPYLRKCAIDEHEAIEKYRFLLEDSIRLRLRSDVPVGFALSGGLDSSAIVSLATKKYKVYPPYQTFSMCYNESEFDESPYVNAVLDSNNVDGYKLSLDPSYVIDNMDLVIKSHDIPPTAMTIFAHHKLCETSSSKGTKVILEGQGPDETIAGYKDFFWAYLSELLLSFKWYRAIDELHCFRKMNNIKYAQAARQLYHSVFSDWINTHKDYNLYPHHGISYLNFDGVIDINAHRENIIVRKQKSVNCLHRIRLKLLRAILHNVDRSSMSHSVEVRNPFLDYRLIEYCLSLPVSLKIRKGLQKYIIREAMSDVLPKKIRERTDKMGFSSPESVWARTHLRDYYRESFRKLEEVPFIKSKAIQSKFEEFLSGRIPYDRVFWRFAIFQRWLSIYKISV